MYIGQIEFYKVFWKTQLWYVLHAVKVQAILMVQANEEQLQYFGQKLHYKCKDAGIPFVFWVPDIQHVKCTFSRLRKLFQALVFFNFFVKFHPHCPLSPNFVSSMSAFSSHSAQNLPTMRAISIQELVANSGGKRRFPQAPNVNSVTYLFTYVYYAYKFNHTCV